MKTLIRPTVIIICLLAASMALAHYWLAHPGILAVPPFIGIPLANWYGAQNAKQANDLEMIIALFSSVCVVSAFTLLVNGTLRGCCKGNKDKKHV